MKFVLMTLPSLPAQRDERARLRPIGRSNPHYQAMLEELTELAQIADQMGFWGFSFAEHHFHSEGSEMNVAPNLLMLYLADRTQRLKFGPVGYVIPGWDPIRLAEEIAVVDHMTKGRVFAGFARGYQDRWLNVLGQKYHVQGSPMDGSSIDAHNRAVFDELVEVIKLAWTEESFTFKGQYYQVPYPYEGIQRWPLGKIWTARYGAPGEVDEDGTVKRICVVPKPYQLPHPPLFQAFSASESTVRWAAKHESTPVIIKSDPEGFRHLCEVYREEAAAHGRMLPLGQNVGAARGIFLGSSYEEGHDEFMQRQGIGWPLIFGAFGFYEAFRLPGETGPVPRTAERVIEAGYALIGTPDQVRRRVNDLIENANPEYFFWICDQGTAPRDVMRRQLDLSARIIEEFGEPAPSVEAAQAPA